VGAVYLAIRSINAIKRTGRSDSKAAADREDRENQVYVFVNKMYEKSTVLRKLLNCPKMFADFKYFGT
jgi:hypothetical protein